MLLELKLVADPQNWAAIPSSERRPSEVISRASNIAFFLDWAQMSDLDFGLIRQNISIRKASFRYQWCPLSLKSGKLWLNSYVYWISITSYWFYSQQFSLPYSKMLLFSTLNTWKTPSKVGYFSKNAGIFSTAKNGQVCRQLKNHIPQSREF